MGYVVTICRVILQTDSGSRSEVGSAQMERSWRAASPGCCPDERERVLMGANYCDSDSACSSSEAWRRAVVSRHRITCGQSPPLATAEPAEFGGSR